MVGLLDLSVLLWMGLLLCVVYVLRLRDRRDWRNQRIRAIVRR